MAVWLEMECRQGKQPQQRFQRHIESDGFGAAGRVGYGCGGREIESDGKEESHPHLLLPYLFGYTSSLPGQPETRLG